MPDVNQMTEADRFKKKAALASGFIRREMVENNLVTLADMKADGLWEQAPGSIHWVKRDQEFVAKRHDARSAFAADLSAAEIALAAALIALEPHLPPQMDGPPYAIAPNRQPYVLVPTKADGEPFKTYRTSAEAIAVWQRAILEYAAENHGTVLWWRARPEIGGGVDDDTAEPRWLVYSRLMIGTPLIVQVRHGQVLPTSRDIDEGRITAEQIEELGLVYDVSTDCYERPGKSAA